MKIPESRSHTAHSCQLSVTEHFNAI